MSIWIVLFVVLFAGAVILSRRGGATHGGGCHGGAHSWPPDDIAGPAPETRAHEAPGERVESRPASGSIALSPQPREEREQVGAAAGPGTHDGHRHGC